MVKKHTSVKSVEEFIGVTSPLRSKWFDYRMLSPWFRGHENAEWDLKPQLYRWKDPADLEMESEVREEFCIRAPALSDFIKPSDNPTINSWEWYFIMQHYRAPTRLLDWTQGSLMALYFAVRSNTGKVPAAVWVLNPWELNQAVIKRYEVLPPADLGTLAKHRNLLNKWLPDRFHEKSKLPKLPIAVFPTHSIRRISAQRSCFTVHGSVHDGFSKFVDKQMLIKITIPGNETRQIRQSLETCGVDETTIFPDLEALGRAIDYSWKT